MDQARVDVSRRTFVLLFVLVSPTALLLLTIFVVFHTNAQMVMELSKLSAKSPIFDHVGNTVEQEGSYASITVAASKEVNGDAIMYQDLVVGYCIEWERVISTRVDNGMKKTKELHKRLNHYQTKVERASQEGAEHAGHPAWNSSQGDGKARTQRKEAGPGPGGARAQCVQPRQLARGGYRERMEGPLPPDPENPPMGSRTRFGRVRRHGPPPRDGGKPH